MVLDYVPSRANIIIVRILFVIVGLIIGIWWGTNPESFWKYFKYVFIFWILLNVTDFFDKDKDKDK